MAKKKAVKKAAPKAKAKTSAKVAPIKKAAKTAKPAKKRPSAPRSQTLPGMEQVRHVRLDRLCEGISECRSEMNEWRTIEGEKCRESLVYMHDNAVTTYRFAGIELARVPGEEKLRVRSSKEKATLETEDESGSGQDAGKIGEALTESDLEGDAFTPQGDNE